MKKLPYTTDPSFIKNLRSGIPTGPGPLVREFLSSPLVEACAVEVVSQRRLYETDWGFVSECPPPFLIWDFYAADVWRQGTDLFYDRFLSAWKNEAEPVLDAACEREGELFFISFDDGISSNSCMSLGCLGTPTEQVQARNWVADSLLPTLWPSMLAHVLDTKHRFATEWRCF